MKSKNREVKRMTNKQLSALLEAIKIIVEKSKDTGEIQNALTQIQSVLKNPK